MTRGGFRGRLGTWRCLRRCLHRNVAGIEACLGDQGCGICRRIAIEQGEVETGCFASESQIPACWWLRQTVSRGVLGTDVVSGPNVRAHRTLDNSYGS